MNPILLNYEVQIFFPITRPRKRAVEENRLSNTFVPHSDLIVLSARIHLMSTDEKQTRKKDWKEKKTNSVEGEITIKKIEVENVIMNK